MDGPCTKHLTCDADRAISLPVHVRWHAAVVIHRIDHREKGHSSGLGRRRLYLWRPHRDIIALLPNWRHRVVWRQLERATKDAVQGPVKYGCICQRVHKRSSAVLCAVRVVGTLRICQQKLLEACRAAEEGKTVGKAITRPSKEDFVARTAVQAFVFEKSPTNGHESTADDKPCRKYTNCDEADILNSCWHCCCWRKMIPGTNKRKEGDSLKQKGSSSTISFDGAHSFLLLSLHQECITPHHNARDQTCNRVLTMAVPMVIHSRRNANARQVFRRQEDHTRISSNTHNPQLDQSTPLKRRCCSFTCDSNRG